MLEGLDKKRVFSWALYDWANSAFATTVVAGFFPIFFKKYWAGGMEATESTLRLGFANSGASIIVALLAPVIGAIADRGGAKKKFLAFFAFMGVVMTGGLALVSEGETGLAILVYVMATIGWSGGNAVYDALIVSVSSEEKLDLVSALGFSIGYLGGGILFALDVFMVTSPETFGLADATQAVKVSFVTVALWWAGFSIPVFLFVPEPDTEGDVGGFAAVGAGFRQLAETFREIRKLKTVGLFLLGYWLYIDGVDTIVRMAVDYGLSIGLPEDGLIIALLVTQFVGFPAALAFGKLGEKLGAKTGIYIAIVVYIGVCIWAYQMESAWEFYALAVAIGLVQGGIQSLSRSFFARLVPRDRAAEFFGFYNMIGKYAAVVGPLLMGWVGALTGNPRLGILSIIVLLVGGGVLLFKVPDPARQSG